MFKHDNFLVQHAINHVWCGPELDRQHTIAPVRFTPIRGAIYDVNIGMSRYNLPVKGKVFDLFTFGDLLPSAIGMVGIEDSWVRADAHCNGNDLLVLLFNVRGQHYPISKAWFLYTRHGELVIAIERITNQPDYHKGERLFCRWRRAAYFSSEQPTVRPGVYVDHMEFTGDIQVYQNFRQKYLSYINRPTGHVTTWLNGYRIRDYVQNDLKPGDHLEYCWDDDVKEVLEIPLKDLIGFHSIKDGKQKYLVNRPGLGTMIDYLDDVDFYLLNYELPQRYKGVFYHQSKQDSARMVTHRDYALCSDYVHAALLHNFDSTDRENIVLEVIVRHSGYLRGLVDERHRIKELFRLDEPKRLQAMTGVDAGVEIWKAQNLEMNPYLDIMSAKIQDVTPALVAQAYGYHAMSRLTGLVPIKVLEGERKVELYFGQYTRCSVFEYDVNGRLLGFYPHSKGTQYATSNVECRYIEAFAGQAGTGLSTIYDDHLTATSTWLSEDRDYRFYMGEFDPANDLGTWEDITGRDDLYTIQDGLVVWGNIPQDKSTAIRNDLDFLTRTIDLDTQSGMLLFSIGTDEVYPDRASMYTLMDIPPGEFDLFLNGYGLTKDIDYYGEWPEYCIVSRRYFDSSLEHQRVTIRARGFCNDDLSLSNPEDSGWVFNKQLSRNGRYNLRNDMVTRCDVGGRIYTVGELTFAEDGTLPSTVDDGLPYRVNHPYVPLMDLVPEPTKVYRDKSLVDDQQIEDYLSLYRPEDPSNPILPVQAKYVVVSPFISRITADLLQGFITVDDYEGDYSQQSLSDRFTSYLYLLDYDPIVNQQSENLVEFHPFFMDGVELDLYQFRMVERLIATFLEGRIPLERYCTIIERG